MVIIIGIQLQHLLRARSYVIPIYNVYGMRLSQYQAT